MNEQEVFDLPEGGQVKTGLLLAQPGEVMPMVGEYPDAELLDNKDIERSLAGNLYLQERKRMAPYIINQATVGKCCPSANVGAVDQVRDNAGMPHEALSDNHLYWRVNGGVDSGASLISTFKEIQRGGIGRRIVTVDGKQYRIPGDIVNRRQLPANVVNAADTDGQLFVAMEAYLVPKDYAKFVRVVATALAKRQPIVWAWHVGQAGMRLSNGYLNQGRGPGNHANVAHSAKYVGGADIVHPSNRNSWGPTVDALFGPMGTGWGEGGFALVTMQDFYACSRYHDFYVVTSVKQRKDEQLLAHAA